MLFQKNSTGPEPLVLSPRSRVPGSESLVPNPRIRVVGPESLVPNPQSRVPKGSHTQYRSLHLWQKFVLVTRVCTRYKSFHPLQEFTFFTRVYLRYKSLYSSQDLTLFTRVYIVYKSFFTRVYIVYKSSHSPQELTFSTRVYILCKSFHPLKDFQAMQALPRDLRCLNWKLLWKNKKTALGPGLDTKQKDFWYPTPFNPIPKSTKTKGKY